MTNCERCYFYEHCNKTGRSKDKNCIYEKKAEETENDKLFRQITIRLSRSQ